MGVSIIGLLYMFIDGGMLVLQVILRCRNIGQKRKKKTNSLEAEGETRPRSVLTVQYTLRYVRTGLS